MARRILSPTNFNSRTVENNFGKEIVLDTMVIDDSTKVSGFYLHRREWSNINHSGTYHGQCNDNFIQWNVKPSSECECGE